jgi:PKD domain
MTMGRAGRMALAAASSLLLLWAPSAASAVGPTPLPPQDISAPANDAGEPQVAVDAAGDAVAVWSREDGAHHVVQAASRPAGGSWSPPEDLSAPGRDALEPRLAVNAAGDAVAVWQRSNGSRTVVQSASRRAGGSWSTPVDLSDATWNADEPAVAVSPTGEAIALWSRYDGLRDIVQSAIGTVGRAWGPGVNRSAPGGNGRQPQVVLDPAGDAVAVWIRYDGSDYIVQSSERPAGGSWGPAVDVSPEGEATTEPQLDVGPAGQVVAVWTRLEAAVGTIEASAKALGGPWPKPDDLSPAGQDAEAPQVAVGPTGEAVAVWVSAAAAPTQYAQGAVLPPGGAWSTSTDLSAFDESAEEPHVAIGPDGTAVAVWAQKSGAPAATKSSTKAPGAPWGPAVQISGYGAGAAGPRIAFDPLGDAVAVWTHVSDFKVLVQAAGLDGASPELRDISIPAAATMERPVTFSVAPLDVWSPLSSIVWTFPGGSTASGPIATHTFARPGSYAVGLLAADALGRSSSVERYVRVYPKARASHIARVRGRRARLRVQCPSPAGCGGLAKLIAAVRVRHGSRSVRKRRRVGRTRFALAGLQTKIVPVRLSRPGLATLRRAGRHGVKAQLTGPGIKHRLVILLRPRRARHNRRHTHDRQRG